MDLQVSLKGYKSCSGAVPSGFLGSKQPAHSYSAWKDDANGDKYNVLSIFARKSKYTGNKF